MLVGAGEEEERRRRRWRGVVMGGGCWWVFVLQKNLVSSVCCCCISFLRGARRGVQACETPKQGPAHSKLARDWLMLSCCLRPKHPKNLGYSPNWEAASNAKPPSDFHAATLLSIHQIVLRQTTLTTTLALARQYLICASYIWISSRYFRDTTSDPGASRHLTIISTTSRQHALNNGLSSCRQRGH